MVVRVQRCKQLLRRFSAGTHSTIVFSDEKLFTVEASINRQNDRIIAPDISAFHLNAYSVFTAKNILSTVFIFHLVLQAMSFQIFNKFRSNNGSKAYNCSFTNSQCENCTFLVFKKIFPCKKCSTLHLHSPVLCSHCCSYPLSASHPHIRQSGNVPQ